MTDLARPQRVVQLCHPDLRNEFPPLHTASSVAAHNLPAQLTSFIARQSEISSLHDALAGKRLGLPHVYAKLGIASRVQLVQEAARNA